VSKQTLTLIIILFLFTSALVALAVYQTSSKPNAPSSKPTPSVPTANPNNPNVADTSLLFGELQIITASESATATLSGANTYSLPIFIDTGANNVSTVQLELAFDPDVLTDVDINPADFFENPVILIHHIDSSNGRVSFALGVNNSSEAISIVQHSKQGQNMLALLTFKTPTKIDLVKTQQAVNTTVSFLPKTFVIADGFDESALKSTNSAELTFDN
jgi:hypothetical protein